MEVFSLETTTFLYIKNGRVLGCLVVSNEEKCFEMILPTPLPVTPSTDTNSSLSASNDSNTPNMSTAVEPCTPVQHHGGGGLEASMEWETATTLRVPLILGVRVIWVHSSMRRMNIASKLLDAARRTMLFGETLPRTACAFTSPTADGHLFATRYCGTNKLMVFNP